MNEQLKRLKDQLDFLIDAWVRGMCDAREVEEGERRFKDAKAELDREPQP